MAANAIRLANVQLSQSRMIPRDLARDLVEREVRLNKRQVTAAILGHLERACALRASDGGSNAALQRSLTSATSHVEGEQHGAEKNVVCHCRHCLRLGKSRLLSPQGSGTLVT